MANHHHSFALIILIRTVVVIVAACCWYDATAFHPPYFVERQRHRPIPIDASGRRFTASSSLHASSSSSSSSITPTDTSTGPATRSTHEETFTETRKVGDSDDFEFIRHYTELAIRERGNAKGFKALRVLSEKCQQRVPYCFDADHNKNHRRKENDDNQDDDDDDDDSSSVVSHFRQVLPSNITEAFLEQVREMESRGWLSTNPDSVDGLPSLHLNLVSHGQPVVVTDYSSTTTDDDDDDDDSQNDFQNCLSKLLALVEDPIYNSLLPRVRTLLNSSSIQVSDIFLRRYGQEVCGEVARRGISAHYDVESRVTSVVALDDVAADGRNGLYTSYLSNNSDGNHRRPKNRRATRRSTSNHAALRRFFPLQRGDGVVHTWDILHGVDVEPHLDRTSLIIWFTEDEKKDDTSSGNEGQAKEATIAPWLRPQDTRRQGDNDVTDFVLASAISSMKESFVEMDLEQRHREKLTELPCENKLYLRSAENGNTFALTRVGSLIEDQAFDEHLIDEAMGVLDRLRDLATLPAPMRMEPATTLTTSSGEATAATNLAMRFWFEGAVQGNPLAQRALADELMMRASETGDEDTRILAGVLFGLAAQQGDEVASEALSRVVDFDLAVRNIQDEDGFRASPVVQTAQAALEAC